MTNQEIKETLERLLKVLEEKLTAATDGRDFHDLTNAIVYIAITLRDMNKA